MSQPALLRITSVSDGSIALQAVREQMLDCLVVDPATPGLDPVELVEEIQRKSPDCALPILVFSEGSDVAADGAWQRVARNPGVHWVHSLERLLAEIGKGGRETVSFDAMEQSGDNLAFDRALPLLLRILAVGVEG